jgi:glycosyltransferase involved in cell wall biosynthesis
MSTTQIDREEEQASGQAVRLLYICDFPPSNFGGGPILMSRLLREYPPDRVVVLTSTRYARVSPREGRLHCEEVTVPISDAWGRWGLGRLRALLNWLKIPLVALAATKIIKRRHIEVMVTVLHGQFYVAAALAAWWKSIPYVLVVHDDCVTSMRPALNLAGRRLARTVVRNAAHVYAVSPEMQGMLKAEFGVESELQMPAAEPVPPHLVKPMRSLRAGSVNLVYAGSITDAVEDSLRLLAGVVMTGKLKEYGIAESKLHLYTFLREDQKRAWGWDHPDLVINGWVPQGELSAVLRRADILFLPFSFSRGARHTVETAFPSKTADYLSSGRPILVFGPSYSSLAAYAAREGFAEVVTESSPDALARGIQRVALLVGHAEGLTTRALQVFSQYHDIRQQRSQFNEILKRIAGGKHS